MLPRASPACHAGVVTGSLADVSKMAAEARLALASVSLTGRRTTIVLLGNCRNDRICTYGLVLPEHALSLG